METLVWIFSNVMPWVGVYFTVATLVFFGFFAYEVFKIRGIKNITSSCDITDDAIDTSGVVNIIPVLLIGFISWLGEKIIIAWIDIKRKRAGMECRNENCDGRLDARNKLTLNYGSGAGNFRAYFCRECRRIHYPAGDLVYSPFTNKGRNLFLHLDGITVVYKTDEEQD